MNDRIRIRAAAALAALLAVSLGLVAPASAALDPKYDPAKLTIPLLHPVKEVKLSRHVLGNGLVLYLLENHDLPVVLGQSYVKGSSLWEPADTADEKSRPIESPMLLSAGSCSAMPRIESIIWLIGGLPAGSPVPVPPGDVPPKPAI